MNTFQKMKTAFIVSGALTVTVLALKCAAMFLEFDREIGYFASFSPLNTVADILLFLSLVFFLTFFFKMKKRELFPIINYSSSPFRFFSSTSGCLMLVYAYVKWNEYLTERASFSASNVKRVNFLLITAVLSVVAAAGLMAYAFGRNEKNSPKRAFLAAAPAGVVLVRAIEIQFDGNVEMNDPIKISFQIASIVLMLALVYFAKCEFDIHETSPVMRTVTLLLTSIFVLPFAITTVVCYYTKVNTVFSYLVDALLYLSLTGFVLCSYTPCKVAKPLCDAKWLVYDEEVTKLNVGAQSVDEDEEYDEEAEQNSADEPSDTETKTEENNEN